MLDAFATRMIRYYEAFWRPLISSIEEASDRLFRLEHNVEQKFTSNTGIWLILDVLYL